MGISPISAIWSGANLAKLLLACLLAACCRASRERRRSKRSAPPHSCTLRRCAAAPVVLFCLRFSYWVVPISCYACALPSALSLSHRSRFCPTLFDTVLLLFRCSVVKGRERERERSPRSVAVRRAVGVAISLLSAPSRLVSFLFLVLCAAFTTRVFCHWIVNLLLYETRVVNFCKERKAEVLPWLPPRACLPARPRPRPPAASFEGRVCVACFVCVCPCVFPFLLGIGKNVNGMGCPSGTPPRRC